MTSSTLLKTGIIGMVISGLCCFTPVLAILLGILGFSVGLVYLDAVLIPALLFFFLLTVIAFRKKNEAGLSHD